MKWTQEQLEQLVLQFLKENYPEFQIREATLQAKQTDDRITSWWIACEHGNGDESLMEDEQVILLLQQQQKWKEISEVKVFDTDQQGFVLSVVGR
ncbi:MAG TPA: hypothetical protein VJ824_10855 [Bacillota bacterium]|nr:hypothetical protein [Bacillota bacterium]